MPEEVFQLLRLTDRIAVILEIFQEDCKFVTAGPSKQHIHSSRIQIRVTKYN